MIFYFFAIKPIYFFIYTHNAVRLYQRAVIKTHIDRFRDPRVGVDVPAVLLPSNFHDAAEGSLKRPNSTLYKGFRRRPAPFVVPAPQNTAAQRAPT